jgi:predicted GNAT family acetyltransferase
MSGPSNLIEKFRPYIKVKEDSLSYMGVIKNINLKRKYLDVPINIIKTEKEISIQYDLLMSTNEYVDCLPENKNDYILSEIKGINETSNRTAYLMMDNEMVSSCSTAKEGEKSAIIIGVVTNPKNRNKGYGTEVLIGLINVLLKEGKYPYLFYNNPAARRVYRKIGITEICEWRVIYKDI